MGFRRVFSRWRDAPRCLPSAFQGSDGPQRGQHHRYAEGVAEESPERVPLRGVETHGGAQVSHGFLRNHSVGSTLRLLVNRPLSFVSGPTRMSGGRSTGPLPGSTMC